MLKFLLNLFSTPESPKEKKWVSSWYANEAIGICEIEGHSYEENGSAVFYYGDKNQYVPLSETHDTREQAVLKANQLREKEIRMREEIMKGAINRINFLKAIKIE